MANTFVLDKSCPITGLGTSSFTVVTASYITVSAQCTIPCSAQSSSQSALQIVINQNGSAKVTVGGSSTNPTPNQPSISASTRLNCAAGDVITVVLSSANAIDSVPNNVKGMLNAYAGY